MQQKTLKTCLLFVFSGEADPLHHPCNRDHVRPAVWPPEVDFGYSYICSHQPVSAASGVWICGHSRGTGHLHVKLFNNTIWKLELKKLVLTKCLYMAVNLIEKYLWGGYQLIYFSWMILLCFSVLGRISVTTVVWASSVRLHRQFPGNTTIAVPSCCILDVWNCSQSHALPTWTDCINWHFFLVVLLFTVGSVQFALCMGQF